MTNQRHPITPPPELLQLWFEQHDDYNKGIKELLIEAARYGADQELEACCEWLDDYLLAPKSGQLRAARRPNPPSLKEQALAELAEWENVMDIASDSPIRRALEQLDD